MAKKVLALTLAIACVLLMSMSCVGDRPVITTPAKEHVVELPTKVEQGVASTPEEKPAGLPTLEKEDVSTPLVMTVDDNVLSIVIGEPSANKTLGADGYYHKGQGFNLEGGSARPMDSKGDIVPLYPGVSVVAPLTIVNGRDHARTFHIYLIPLTDSINPPFPTEYYTWINIEDAGPKVAIGGSKKLAVTLSVPYDVPRELRGNSYNFALQVEDWSQTGFVQIAYQFVWLFSFEA